MAKTKGPWREDVEVFGLVDRIAQKGQPMRYRDITAAVRALAQMDILRDKRRMVGVLRKQGWRAEKGTDRWFPPQK